MSAHTSRHQAASFHNRAWSSPFQGCCSALIQLAVSSTTNTSHAIVFGQGRLLLLLLPPLFVKSELSIGIFFLYMYNFWFDFGDATYAIIIP